MKDKKLHTKQEMIDNQLIVYGGTLSWANYAILTFIRFGEFYNILEKVENKYRIVK